MLICSFFIIFGACSPLKISHLTALLQFKDPYSSKVPHFTISAEGGCFNWTSLNSNIVRVIPNYQSDECSTSALVEVVATGPNRRSTAIIAENNVGSTLKCDVFVDSVKKISILTTTRSIYLESSLETLSLLASDSDNNTFTSLEGTEIKWKIDDEHIRSISADEAKLFLHGIMPNKSSSLIIQGAKIGKTWAEATLNGIHHAHVDLVVVKALAFLPSPIIRTLPYHHIPFKLCCTRGDNINQNYKHNGSLIGVTVDKDHISHVELDSAYCISQIQLPSNLYTITTSNSKSMTADQSGYATTREIGESTITATDVSISDNIASTLVYVTYPSIVDQPEQYIALGDDPVFHPLLKDRDGRPLDIFEEIHWDIKGEWNTVGTKHIRLEYHNFSFIAIVHVCPPLIMDPPEAVLPVGHNGFTVTPKGGSGFYDFYVDDKTILDYSRLTYTIRTFREGRTKIRVQDAKIRKYYNYSDILVSRIAYIDIQIEKRELINEYFQPKCDIFAIESKHFSVEIPNKTLSTNPEIVSSQMKAIHPGFSEIYCEAGPENTQSAKITVSSADHLRAEVIGRGSPNSIIPLTTSGGVLQWPESQPPAVEVTCPGTKVTIFKDNHFSVDSEYFGYCTATMQNKKTDLNPFPLRVTSDFWLNVSYVNRFDLYVIDEKASDNPQCNAPLQRLPYSDVFNDAFRYRIKTYRIIPTHLHKFVVFPRDIQGNIINYYSAVPFELRTSNGEHLAPMNNHGRHGETIYYFNPPTTLDLSLTSPDLNPSVTSLIEIKDIKLNSPRTVYYKPSHTYKFSIEDGSGFFGTNFQNAQIVTGNLHVQPQQQGTYLIPIFDSCKDNLSINFQLTALSVEVLKIIAPPIVFVNKEFDAQVKAYGQRSVLMPEELLPEAAIHLKSDIAHQIKIDTWRLKPTKVGRLYLTATAENNVTTDAYVDVVDSLVISPQYIEILPGEREFLSIISGPHDIKFDFEDGDQSIAKVVRANNQQYAVVGITPGNITINAYINRQELMKEMQPFTIYVRVLKPFQLIFDPSTKNPIQSGYIGLRLIVLTDAGYKIPKKAKWNWKPQSKSLTYSYFQVNNSYAFVNLSYIQHSEVKDVIVQVEAYDVLKAEFVSPVEPKLVLTTPQLVLLPPHCTFQIGIRNYSYPNMIRRCTFETENESIATCENGLIKSYSTEGETTVHVILGHQRLAVTVRVSYPVFLHIHQRSSYEFRLMLLDPYGLLYSSVNGVRFVLSGPKGFTASKINSADLFHAEFNSDELIKLDAKASNSEFSLETSYSASIRQRITPSNVVLMKGVSLQFQCTASNPRWKSYDPSILYISADGSALARKSGSTTISCGPFINSKVNVTEMIGIKLVNQLNDEYQIYPEYKPPFSRANLNEDFDFGIPSDLQFKCIFEDTSCASVYFKKNQTGYFCVLKRVLANKTNDFELSSESEQYVKCPPDSKLKVSVSSDSANLKVEAETFVASLSKIDFGIPNENTVTYSDVKRIIKIPIKLHYADVKVVHSDGIEYEWLPDDSGILIRIADSFRSGGTISFSYLETNEKAEIKIVHESSLLGDKNLFHIREFNIHKNIIFVFVLILMFTSIFFIVLLATSN